MALILYTDPHLGLNRQSGTTPSSRLKLQQCIQSTLEYILSLPGEKVNCGDLFQNANNPEHVIQYGSSVVGRTTLTLAGNHDLISDSTKLSSLQLVAEFHPGKIAIIPFGEAGIHVQTIGGVHTVSIPHTTTQSLFEESLEEAVQHVTTTTASVGMPRVLLFHANFDNDFTRDSETSLNLTPEWAERLLNSGYRHIIGGHEHNGRDLYDGRLIMLGNTFPTSFHDASSSKRIAILDETGIRFEQVWDSSQGYAEYAVDNIPAETTAQFVKIEGEAPSDQIAAVSKTISKLWKTSPNLLALKSGVTVTGLNQEIESTTATAETLPALIEKELQSDKPMLQLWREFCSCGGEADDGR